MRVHSGKPFPISFYERSSFRLKHYLVWWCVCNELDADAEGWIRISRSDLEEVFARTQRAKPNQITSILQTLATHGYLEVETLAGRRWFSTDAYVLRVRADAWEPKQIVRKVYPQRDTRAERKARYERRLASLASGEQSSLS